MTFYYTDILVGAAFVWVMIDKLADYLATRDDLNKPGSPREPKSGSD